MTRKSKTPEVHGSVAIIRLTRGFCAVIDTENLPKVDAWDWHASIEKGNVYGRRRDGLRLHRLIMDARPGQIVDHIDGNGLNNCRSNLRFATQAQNLQNAKVSRANKSGAKGVSWDAARAKWKASICIGGKTLNIGHFDQWEAAKEAYGDAARANYGEFARLS